MWVKSVTVPCVCLSLWARLKSAGGSIVVLAAHAEVLAAHGSGRGFKLVHGRTRAPPALSSESEFVNSDAHVR